MINRKRHSAGVTMEVAIGVALAVAVLFVILGLFNNNLKNMIVNTNLSNIFKNNDVKTAFSAFNKDYSSSQINVQIMGEQGLARLRKKANNLALTLIESPFNDTNANANTIEYLSLAIEAIVGRGDICVYMKNDSDKFCNEDGIGGYAYLINPSDPSVLTMKKVDSSGASVSATVDLPLNTTLGSAISSSDVPKDSSGRSTLSKNEKYSFIKDMTNKFQSHITSGSSLVRMLNNFVSTTGSSGGGGGIGTFVTAVTTTVASVGSSLTALVTGTPPDPVVADTTSVIGTFVDSVGDSLTTLITGTGTPDTTTPDTTTPDTTTPDTTTPATTTPDTTTPDTTPVTTTPITTTPITTTPITTTPGPVYTVQELIDDCIALLDNVKTKANTAYNNRSGRSPHVDSSDKGHIYDWANQLISTINEATTKQAVASAVFSSFDTSRNWYDEEDDVMVFRLAYDQHETPSACQTLVQGLVDIAQKHDLNKSNFGISEVTTPSFKGPVTYYTVPSGKYICGVKK